MKKQYLPTGIGLLLCLLILSGCAGLLTSFEKPRISLADIRVISVKTLETAFLAELRVTNPNDMPLEIRGLSCDLELDGRHFASGVQGEQQTIPPYDSTLVPVEIHASVIDMVSSVLGIIQTTGQHATEHEEIRYKLTGIVRISSGGFFRNLPFDSEGELPVR